MGPESLEESFPKRGFLRGRRGGLLMEKGVMVKEKMNEISIDHVSLYLSEGNITTSR